MQETAKMQLSDTLDGRCPAENSGRHLRHVAAPEDPFVKGRDLLKSGQPLEAISQFARAIEMRPNEFAAYLELGLVMHALGERDTARSWYLMALSYAESPAKHSIQIELGGVCFEMGLHLESADWFLLALDSGQLSAGDFYRAGSGLARMRRISEASRALERSVAIAPTATAWTELGFCQFRQGAVGEAETSYRKALRCDPNYASAHANLGLVLLHRGEYRLGFKEYEWRLQLGDFFRTGGFQAPRWAGEPLGGKSILLHAEQGYGDTLQFLRYIPLIAELGATVVLIVQPALDRLVRNYPGVAGCLGPGDDASGISYHCPLMSLPFVLGTNLETIPSFNTNALLPKAAGDVAAQKASETPSPSPAQLRPLQVGIVWAGNREHVSDAQRSVSLACFGALGDCARSSGREVSFTSLQHGPAAQDIAQTDLPFPVHDVCSEVRDFADTVLLVAGLDLVITVDTAVAHLAASLGKPVWVLLGSVPEWRWGADGDTTPWYPSVRLFRSGIEGGWEGIFKCVAEALTEWCRS